MMRFHRLVIVIVTLSLSGADTGQAQNDTPQPTPEQAQGITNGLNDLQAAVGMLLNQSVDPGVVVDIAVYAKAVEWISRHREYQNPNSIKWTQAVIDRGLLRARQALRGESPWMLQRGRTIARGYQSRIDGSIQPYAVTFPRDYAKPKAGEGWRLDVVLHGRDGTLTEVKFLNTHDGSKEAPEDQKFVQLDVYGRGNNAYRWAGETDVFEAIDNFLTMETKLGRGDWIDPKRIVLRGFSMGGAGAWHIGLHRPDRWCVIGPGAGFTTTHGYVSNLPEKLPDYQEACLRIYDAVDYAANVAELPVVAYAGAEDKQIQAAQNIQGRVGDAADFTLLVAPGLGHKFPPEWQAKAEKLYSKYADPENLREEFPERVRFVTHTLKYPSCRWVEVLGLEKHYQKARIDAARTDEGRGLQIRTQNVTAFRIATDLIFPPSVNIDGQEVPTEFYADSLARRVHFERVNGKWTALMGHRWMVDRFRQPRKLRGLQGPIDDAFMESFLCVRGSGVPAHPDVGAAIDARLQQFQAEWDRFMRGEPMVKLDREINEADLATSHLILFGDPASNALTAEVLKRLPLEWDNNTIRFNGKEYPADEHFPVMIFPNPLNPMRYVVLNSGHTFHARDFLGTNALLYPRLGDYAILKPVPTDKDPAAIEVIEAGLFDEEWKLPRSK